MAIKDTCKFGAFYDGGTYPTRLARIQAWEARYGARMDIINDFRKAGYGSISGSSGHIPTAMAAMQSTGIQGRRHLMSWEWAAGDTLRTAPFRPYEIVYTTQHDAYITAFAEALAGWGNETYIRLNHEMNANWYGWAGDASCYKDHWQKIVQLFRDAGADNVKWFWCTNGGDVPNTWNKQESYYPGDDYVDVVGFDQYNAYTGWHPFGELIATPYARMRAIAPSKKVWIGETGCPEPSAAIGGSTGHTRSEWYTDMFNTEGYDEIEYIIMFDTQGGYNWRIDGTTTSRDTFASLLSSSALRTVPPPVNVNSGTTTALTRALS